MDEKDDEESGYSTSDSSGMVVDGVWFSKDRGMPARPEDESICRPRQYNPQEMEERRERTAASSAYRRDHEQSKDVRGATGAALANAPSRILLCLCQSPPMPPPQHQRHVSGTRGLTTRCRRRLSRSCAPSKSRRRTVWMVTNNGLYLGAFGGLLWQ
jgi:hypothetical protein